MDRLKQNQFARADSNSPKTLRCARLVVVVGVECDEQTSGKTPSFVFGRVTSSTKLLRLETRAYAMPSLLIKKNVYEINKIVKARNTSVLH